MKMECIEIDAAKTKDCQQPVELKGMEQLLPQSLQKEAALMRPLALNFQNSKNQGE